jgi:hypothetical protein
MGTAAIALIHDDIAGILQLHCLNKALDTTIGAPEIVRDWGSQAKL